MAVTQRPSKHRDVDANVKERRRLAENVCSFEVLEFGFSIACRTHTACLLELGVEKGADARPEGTHPPDANSFLDAAGDGRDERI